MSLLNYYSNLNLEEIRRNKNSMLYVAAQIDENNVVVDAIIVDEADISDENGLSDSITTSFANSIRQTTGTWKWAGMYQEGRGDVRKIQPGIGDNWNAETSQFYQKKPHDSWILDSNLDWNPPVAKPNNTTKWIWNEETQSWELPESNFYTGSTYDETSGDPDNEVFSGRIGE
mgnify:FL=1|tara:strand:- start:658 stop:1176 length:519 start_codon:yes stop_codon:yes gene_type:complete